MTKTSSSLPRLLLMIACAGAAITASAAAPPPPTEIRALYDLQEKALTSGDVEWLVTRFFTPDAVSAGEGDPHAAVGTRQLRDDYREFASDLASVKIESVRTVIHGRSGWDWANLYFVPKPGHADKHPPSPMRMLFLWSKRQGHWRCGGVLFLQGRFPKPLE